jgi:hypothetical protein
LSANRSSLARELLLLVVGGISGVVVTSVGFFGNEPIILAMGLVLLFPVLVGIPAVWFAEIHASRVKMDGEVAVFTYSPLLLYGYPVWVWCFASLPAALFLVLGSAANWGWGLIAVGLTGLLMLGAKSTSRFIRTELAEIRISPGEIVGLSRSGKRTALTWSEIEGFEAVPHNPVAGNGVRVVGESNSILVYGKIRGVRELKRRLLDLSKERGLPTGSVDWDFGIVTEGDRVAG